MAINSNFSIYEPEAWVEVALGNEYPNRPMISNAVTNVAGADVEGLVANRNKSVNITRADKPTTDPTAYTGADYVLDTPNASEETLTINKHYYKGFSIDKADQRFALPDLVAQHFTPRLNSLMDQINRDIKAEARKFEAAFAELNTNVTKIDDEDLRNAQTIMEARKFASGGMIGVIDPYAKSDLTGLDLFHQADQFGSREVLMQNSLGQAFGFDFFMDNLGDTIADGSEPTVGDAVVAGAVSEGETSITIDDGAGSASSADLNEGDVIYFNSANGYDDWYTVESSTTTNITLKEPLRTDLADNSTISTYAIATGSKAYNEYFYDPSALSLVTAVMPSVDSGSGSGVRRAAGFEPMNGVNYTLTVEETKKGADVLIEVLYGQKLFRPDLGVRYLRGTTTKA